MPPKIDSLKRYLYCGVGPLPKSKKAYGTMEECALLGQISRYGKYKLDSVLLKDVEDYEESKNNKKGKKLSNTDYEKLILKIGSLNSKYKKKMKDKEAAELKYKADKGLKREKAVDKEKLDKLEKEIEILKLSLEKLKTTNKDSIAEYKKRTAIKVKN